ncbi:MAG: helix-turn-helix domain-containing protein [Reyranella sp.]|uniref:helix-turn-helix domain-containing protein n=1 Tax=Reyranella sp. TaxID=1929291 RepID=UPI00121D8AEB|nr:XRE family transcriptional regulator [Reyranella sp.]TAJ37855.1 MAG: helix-turn-helix domain-containing protein [Reyranella sp.]
MIETANIIDLDLVTKLKDPAYRRAFFRAEASAEIARQIILLRKKRDLTQAQLAELAGTGQPAISRSERADYQNWTISTLRRITDALDGRLRVVIEAAEDVLPQYESTVARPIAEKREVTLLATGRNVGLPSIADALRPSLPKEPRLSAMEGNFAQLLQPNPALASLHG